MGMEGRKRQITVIPAGLGMVGEAGLLGRRVQPKHPGREKEYCLTMMSRPSPNSIVT